MFEGTKEEYETLAIREERKRKNTAVENSILLLLKLHPMYTDEIEYMFEKIILEIKKERRRF